MAYGVSVSVPHGIVCIGGTPDGKRSSASAYLLHTDRHHKLLVDTLPPLPLPLDNMAGAYGGGYIYVAGGQSNGHAVNAAFRLRYPRGTAWERLPDFPGSARVQPAAAVQHNATTSCFYLFGGFSPIENTRPAVAHTDGWCYNPVVHQWVKMANIVPHGRTQAITLSGSFGIASGCAHIVFVGGVNKERFERAVNMPLLIAQAERACKQQGTHAAQATLAQLQAEQVAYMRHPAPWYEFNDELVIYHTITDTWVTESQSPLLARAGAAVVECGHEWIVVNGEVKPGVRSTDVTACPSLPMRNVQNTFVSVCPISSASTSIPACPASAWKSCNPACLLWWRTFGKSCPSPSCTANSPFSATVSVTSPTSPT